MKRLFLMMALIMAMVVALSGTAFAHSNGYNAANRDGKIVIKYNNNMPPEYRRLSDLAFASWNKTREETGNKSFPEFVFQGKPTLEAGTFKAQRGLLGYYRYYSNGIDYLWLNADSLGNKSNLIQRTATHESGHATMFDHNNQPCSQTIMRASLNCGKNRTLGPGSHDRDDVANARKVRGADVPGVYILEQTEETPPPGFVVIENLVVGDEKTLASKTYFWEDGYTHIEYDTEK